MSDGQSKLSLKIIDECICESCSCDYCFLKTLVNEIIPSPLLIVQLKCIEKFKWEESYREGEDIGWNEAAIRWADGGYAEAFRTIFDENKSIRQIYKATKQKLKESKSLI